MFIGQGNPFSSQISPLGYLFEVFRERAQGWEDPICSTNDAGVGMHVQCACVPSVPVSEQCGFKDEVQMSSIVRSSASKIQLGFPWLPNTYLLESPSQVPLCAVLHPSVSLWPRLPAL